jgi:hypothetical protein
MFAPAMKQGLIIGLCICLAVTIGQFFGWYDAQPQRIQFVQFVTASSLLLAVLLFAIKRRKTALAGDLSIKDGMRTGMTIAFFAAVVVALYMPLYYAYIDPEWHQALIDRTIEEMRKAGKSEARINEFARNARHPNVLLEILQPFLQIIMIALPESIVVTMLIKSMRD